MRDRLVLHHPRARAFRSRRGAGLLRALAEGLGPGTTLVGSEEPGLADRLRSMEAERDLIVFVGGDGTLHHGLNQVAVTLGVDAPWPRMALFPAGTGNDAARSLAVLLDRDLEDVGSLLAAVERDDPGTPADLGRFRVEGLPPRYFVNFAGFGAPVEWVRLADARSTALLKRLAPKLHYSACSLAVLLRKKSVELSVDTGSARFTGPVFSLLVANARYLGGGLDLGARADLTSGRLAVLRLAAESRAKLLSTLGEARRGGGPELETSSRVRIALAGPTHVNLDGELLALSGEEVVAHADTLNARVAWI